MQELTPIDSPSGESMDRLCERLSEWSSRWVRVDDWPSESLRACGQAGVYQWRATVNATSYRCNDTFYNSHQQFIAEEGTA